MYYPAADVAGLEGDLYMSELYNVTGFANIFLNGTSREVRSLTK